VTVAVKVIDVPQFVPVIPTTGLGFTVIVLSAVAEPQLALVTVSRSVAVPVLPLRILTLVSAALGLAILTSAFVMFPEVPCTLQEGLPLLAVPSRLNVVVPDRPAHCAPTGATAALGFGVTVTVFVQSVVDGQPFLVTWSVSVYEPDAAARTSTDAPVFEPGIDPPPPEIDQE
jgi:hypothetical protein